MSQPRILIVGGSTRAAADSVRRAGWMPVCADLFADLDLQKTAEVIPVRDYPRSLVDDVRGVRADGWFYCGALENYPQLIERLKSELRHCGPLLGTHPEALKLVREPVWLAKTLQTAGVPTLEIRDQHSPPAPDGTWLQKPIASAGGRLIQDWDQSAVNSSLSEPHYFQQRVNGVELSGLLWIENGSVEWLGGSRALVRWDSSRAPTRFSYCGSLGPYWAGAAETGYSEGSLINGPHETDLKSRSVQIVETLVNNVSSLQGLIGLDFRFDGNELWLVEVNPRYTASTELLELATKRSFLNADFNSRDVDRPFDDLSNSQLIGKQILYATERFRVPDLGSYWVGDDPWKIPYIADIPMPNSIVEAGWPICTVLAEGSTWTSVESQLNQRLAEVNQLLKGR